MQLIGIGPEIGLSVSMLRCDIVGFILYIIWSTPQHCMEEQEGSVKDVDSVHITWHMHALGQINTYYLLCLYQSLHTRSGLGSRHHVGSITILTATWD